ncbi:ubiquitin-conjugating enzyme E2 U [Phascolarctos cinereus]|uniref:Ubiquitin-conjugating enzyme E2 U n=1 Tax=Phascolarctos cinereus TaxID=38626 RepID=A0A6P5KSZ7_PHACI|nr:ubiquitin-conjugating enzyme E2 U [Phascolarctos cinereus]
MHCRSYLLLEKEFMDLQEQDLFGITVTPLSNDLLKWLAEVEGLKDTVWEGFTFPLLMKFSVDYNNVPPVVAFSPIPFHPNVDPKSGRPCIDFLDSPDHWDTNYTLSSILLSIQVMLCNPTLTNPVNVEAARVMLEDMSLFNELALKSLYHSSPADEETVPEENAVVSFKPFQVEEEMPKKNIKGISFDEYYKTWSGIATSQTANCFKIPVSHDLSENYKKWKGKSIKSSQAWDAKFHSIMARITRENRLPTKLDRSLIQSIKNAQICTPETNTNVLSSGNKEEIVTKKRKGKEKKKKKKKKIPKESDDMDESWEKEVENLVAWTNELNTTTLED